MSNQEPKKPQRPKSKRVNLTKKEQWEKLLKEVETDHVPIAVIRYLTIHLSDGTEVDVDVDEMLASGMDPDYIEKLINSRLTELDHIIENVDFHINPDSVAKLVQPLTNQLLKNL
jgi:hypothetical protein